MGEFELTVGSIRSSGDNPFPPDFCLFGSDLDVSEHEYVVSEYLIAATRKRRLEVTLDELLEVCQDPLRIQAGHATAPHMQVIEHYSDLLTQLGYFEKVISDADGGPRLNIKATDKLMDLLKHYQPPTPYLETDTQD